MKKQFLVLTACIVASCSGGDELSGEDDSITNNSGLKLTVENLESNDVIEKYRSIQVQVDSDAKVTTYVYMDNVEVYQTNQYSFDYEIDPYLNDIGAKVFKVVSVDDDSNSVEKEFNLIIKHLLFSTDVADYQVNESETVWDMVHDLQGNLLALSELQTGLVKLYGEEALDSREIYYSRVHYDDNTYYKIREMTVYTYLLCI